MRARGSMMAAALAVMACGAVGVAGGAEVDVGADVANAYVFRGVTFNDGFVVQPYVEIGGLPVAIGIWGNLDIDDYDGALNEGQFSEIDLTLSYDLPLDIELFGVGVGYTEYMYPGAEGDADREAFVTFSLDAPLKPTLGLYYGLDGGIKKSLHAGFGIEQAFDLAADTELNLEAAVGYENPDEGKSGFSYYSATATLSYKFLSASIAYIGQIDDKVLPDADGESAGYDVEVVATIGIAYSF